MKQYNTFVRKILFILGSFLFLGIAVGILLQDSLFIASWILGITGNIIYFWMLALRVQNIKDLPKELAVKKMKGSTLSRLATIGLVMLVSILIPGIKLLVVAVGLLMLKPAIYIDFLIQRNILSKERR